ncbi:molecular chaperone [Variovorax dokdonensis]|uniref:Molecular chaperone n=1 Tax=Variovorax dokdonensis TaxID=344883 RepID=A0ABT7NES9_9BURK|nr:molecular chaperone [Variovorax dokdonensis]MDM0046453.1 molecular chaperone [Variovorax dokdonensis]
MFMALSLPMFSHAAVVPDRTRVIYDEGVQSESITVTNKSPQFPFLIQSWIEDATGKKVTAPFVVLPPLQRVEPGERNVLRVALTPSSALPSDRESVFYLNIREIPPKSEAVNALQIALHSRLKLFYRPKSIKPERGTDTTLPMTIRHDAAAGQLVFDNPTPFHITVVGLAGEDKKTIPLESVMVSPMSQAQVPFKTALPSRLNVTHVNDFGGETEVPYDCGAGQCRSAQK